MPIELIPEMPREECGIAAVLGDPEAAKVAYLGLYSLQHRGQEAAGIAAFDGPNLAIHRGQGLVADVFNRENLNGLSGRIALGHVRYSTTGGNSEANIQPLVAHTRFGPCALAHNGNLINSNRLRAELECEGAIFQTTMDTEIILHLLARSQAGNFFAALVDSLTEVQGAYSIVAVREGELIALRDPRGIRPLCLGRKGGAWLVASESCAFSVVGGEYVRDVEPGEFVTLTERGLRSDFPIRPRREAFCIFEFIYYSRPDSVIGGEGVYDKRLEMGRQLAREHPVEADVVVPVPDSSNVAALGFSRESGVPFAMGLIRSHYVGRTFIEPDQRIRHFGAKLKYTPVASVLRDRRVVVVDDSIVRGTTGGKIVAMLREAGAREVHVRISSPPFRNPCFYGIDTPSRVELMAANHSLEEIRRLMGADSLGYLSIEGLRRVFGGRDRFCMACFTNEYPEGVPIGEEFSKHAHEGRVTVSTGRGNGKGRVY
ncbi:MAG: amidophosphoribosyltransferase [Candidatus Sumerlaeia bacterium]